ncbi:PAS domain-containing sensor histidine kinase [Cupriavidus basilensis]|uniref:PAS domain-containing sensor histidine kinase n=2 Tax=Cupriavidus basilensis TaxID=68895 RepID=A0ABT6ALD8_9BURK|nr:PAS domain-containing sensor histidine kinase [Cupriavidus basilensis]MDF3833415.1 PAS domain-containing sensor histidine kinase [Cupriavidus basilensis]
MAANQPPNPPPSSSPPPPPKASLHATLGELAAGGAVLLLLMLLALWFVTALAPRPGGLAAPMLGAWGLAVAIVLSLLLARLRRLRRAAEAHLARTQASEARLAGIIRSSMEAIITVDEAQRIVLFNPMAERLFGCSAAGAIGRSLGDFIPARFRGAHEEHVRRFGVTGVTERKMGQQRVLHALHQDGTEFPIEASISQTQDGGGKLFTVILRDTTERVRAEAALRHSREELQQLSDRVQASREEERRRIARELHDDLGQRLSALKMDLAILASDLKDGGTAPALLDQAAAMHLVIDETVASVRRIAADLRPALLDELGLIPAIDWLAKEFSVRYGIVVATHAAEEENVGERAATAVFRIVQEALSNVVQHADADRVDIELVRYDDHYELTVRDNGRGADGSHAAGGERVSLGLVGIRERARLLGGTVATTQAPGQGFCLTVCFPLQQDMTTIPEASP